MDMREDGKIPACDDNMEDAVVIEYQILDGVSLVIARGEDKCCGNTGRKRFGAGGQLRSCACGPHKVGEFPCVHKMKLAKPEPDRAAGQREVGRCLSGAFQDGQNDALLCRFISGEFRLRHFWLIGMSLASKKGSSPKFEEEGSSRRK